MDTAAVSAARPTPDPLPERWLNVHQAARYVGQGEDAIRAACRLKELQHVRKGSNRAYSFTREWLDRWMMKKVCPAE